MTARYREIERESEVICCDRAVIERLVCCVGHGYNMLWDMV